MFTVPTFVKFNTQIIGSHTQKRTALFNTSINSNIEVTNLTFNNFIKIGDTYYNPRHIQYIKIHDNTVTMKLRDSRFNDTYFFDGDASHHFTNLFNNTYFNKN